MSSGSDDERSEGQLCPDFERTLSAASGLFEAHDVLQIATVHGGHGWQHDMRFEVASSGELFT